MRLCILFIVIACIVIGSGPANCQEKTVVRTFGLSTSIQGEQLDIMVPIWAGPRTVIAPAFSVLFVEDAGVDWALGIAPKFYLHMDRIAPYIGGRTGVFFMSPIGGGEETIDWLLGLAMGGEYFINPRFSFGIEAQLNFTISDDHSGRFGNPGGTTANTATAMFASIYF